MIIVIYKSSPRIIAGALHHCTVLEGYVSICRSSAAKIVTEKQLICFCKNVTVKIYCKPLLVCMMLGTIFCNVCDFSEEIMQKTDKWTAPLFVLFFVMSGAELEFGIFRAPMVIVIGIVYILVRAVGKYYGASMSAKWTKCDPSIVKYLGITLLPQAGVALGMSITAQTLDPTSGSLIRNITLFAVLIYELVGPLLTKIALTKAGDIIPRTVAYIGESDDE